MQATLALFIALTLMSTIAQAGEITVRPRLTGLQLLEKYGRGSTLDQDPESAFKRQFVNGYLAGVADAEQGRTWCDRTAVKTGEIDSHVIGALRERPSADLAEDAAVLIRQVLSRKFPCP